MSSPNAPLRHHHHVWTIEIATVFASKKALWAGLLLGGGSPHLTAKAIALRYGTLVASLLPAPRSATS